MSTTSPGAGPTRWALLGDPLFREVGDEVFVLTRDSQMHWLKNDSARFLWEQLVAAGPPGTTVLELSQALTATFEVQTEAAFSDVSRLSNTWPAMGWLRGRQLFRMAGPPDTAAQAMPAAAKATIDLLQGST